MREHILKLRLYFYEHKQDVLLAMVASVVFFLGTLLIGFSYWRSTRQDNAAVEATVVRTPTPTPQPTTSPIPDSYIFVDVSGEVKRPRTYELKLGSRVQDAIVAAGGMTGAAAKAYFDRNYNYARILQDQEKIYVPSTSEIEEGYFTESSFYIEQGVIVPKDIAASTSSIQEQGVLINAASKEELDRLPGVGPATADKLVKNRPYASFDELVAKSTVSEATLTKFADKLVYE